MRLAKRILELDTELGQNMTRISDLVAASPAAELLEKTGIGPVTAARTLVAWSHPGRVKSEAAFAAIAGVNPIPASSGATSPAVSTDTSTRNQTQNWGLTRYRSFIEIPSDSKSRIHIESAL